MWVLRNLIFVICCFFMCSGLPSNKKNNRPTMNKTKLIIDVDAGVDDAFAIMLAYLKSTQSADLEIVAITCVAGNTKLQNVVVNVLKTLRILNAEHIPVYVGADRSLIITPETDFFYGQDGFGDADFLNPPSAENAQEEHAVHALARLVHQNPGEISIVALGPLTNIALASRLDPMFRLNLKELFIMGGSVKSVGNRSPGIEFNVFTDPEATFIVFNDTNNDQINPIVLLPWETVISNIIDMKWRRNIFGRINNPVIEFFNDIEEISLNKSKTWVPSDGLLMAVFLDPLIASKIERLNVSPALQGELRGSLLVDWTDILGKYKNVILIDKINTNAFKNFLLYTFMK